MSQRPLLSVSSVGSSPLQPTCSPVCHAIRKSFSILGRIEPTATLSSRSPNGRARPFSILGRIEPTATREQIDNALLDLVFQYPRSDRAHCNRLERERPMSSSRLSVSSVGSSPLQRPDPPTGPSSVTLSVSSVGSSPLQPRWAILLTGTPFGFQYPRSDRAHCNLPRGAGRPRGRVAQLSVSSVGSSPLQLRSMGNSGSRWNRLSVSSVGSSPLQLPIPGASSEASARGSFSILGRIEPTATPSEWTTATNVPSFQYPRSDRAHCNEADHVRVVRVLRAFSILGRIEPTATLSPPRTACGSFGNFQYPRSDRAHCNISMEEPKLV